MKERIREMRDALGLTQTAFADQLGLARATVACYENGTRQPNSAVIKLMASEFNVNEEWLRDGTGEMFAVVSRDDVIAAYLGQLLSGDDASTNFQRRLIQALAKLTPEQWQEVEAFARGLLEDPGS